MSYSGSREDDRWSSFRGMAHDWREDFLWATAFYTRIPWMSRRDEGAANRARALRTGPLVGLVVGILGACGFALAEWLTLPELVAAAVAVAVTVLVTGALHEDGLADVADGFGGGAGRAQKLEIMCDSRTGNFGAAAMTLSIILRVAALSAFVFGEEAFAALVAAHVLARGVIPAAMHFMSAARDDGLGASVGRPEGTDVLIALGLAAVIAIVATGLGAGILLLLVACAAAALVGWLARRQVGGYTGDVLGAVEQAAEVAVLVAAAALA
jgi:adenosylcobinamide-GDP ribazoletransferase